MSELQQTADAAYALGDFEAAAEAYGALLAQKPDDVLALYNLGVSLRALKRFDEALAAYEQALRLAPSFPQARHNRATLLLQTGDLLNGFRELEWRKLCPGFVDDARYKLERPWRGEPITGKALYVYCEYFQGDLIQFCRYALAAEQAGAKVTLSAPVAMHALLRTMSPTIALVPEDAPPPAYDYQAALMTLPALFGSSLERVPRAASYLSAEPARVTRWRERIGAQGLKIGIAWSGSARAVERSFPLSLAAAALSRPGVRLISLQKHGGLDQLGATGGAVEVLADFDEGPDLFLDTAAALSCCDLFVTPDTSVAHLAGALGAPTWVALPHLADWRWLEGRADSPWYPTLRLFRQQAPGDWAGVFAQMADVLDQALAKRS